MTDQDIVTDLDDEEIAILREGEGDEAVIPPREELVEAEAVADDEPDDTLIDETPDEGEPELPEDVRKSEEAMARRFGWKPKEEWKGDTTNYFEAGDYLEKVITPRLNRLPELETSVQEMRQNAIRLAQQQQKFSEERRSESLAEIKAAQKRAFDLGDEAKYQESTEKLEKYYTEREPTVPMDDPKLAERQQQANADPAFHEWLPGNNDWYGTNQEATQFAAEVAAGKLRAENVEDVMALPSFARKAFYEDISRTVRARFQLTGQSAPKQSTPKPPASEGAASARVQTNGRAKTGWNTLPKEARASFDLLARQGFYPNSDKGKQEYARDYAKENPA